MITHVEPTDKKPEPPKVELYAIYRIKLPTIKSGIMVKELRAMVKAKQRDKKLVTKSEYKAFKRALRMTRAIRRQHLENGGEAKMDLSGKEKLKDGSHAFVVRIQKLAVVPPSERKRMTLAEAYPPPKKKKLKKVKHSGAKLMVNGTPPLPVTKPKVKEKK